jgi:ectoine hydroxylase-related dioxygenase (phytanoyl-CoA dioxygenase family)
MSEAGEFFEERMCYRNSLVFKNFLFNSEIAKVVAPLMDSSQVRLFFDHLFICGPNTPTEYYWHQDLPYWPVTGKQICSIWLALTDCDRESSALELVPGSHTGPLYGVREFGDEDYGQLGENTGADRIPEFHKYRKARKVISRDVKAGDAFIFTATTFHGSGGNRSPDKRRIAYSTRWIGDDVRWHPRPFRDEALMELEADLKEGDPLHYSHFPLLWKHKTVDDDVSSTSA